MVIIEDELVNSVAELGVCVSVCGGGGGRGRWGGDIAYFNILPWRACTKFLWSFLEF